MQAAAGSVSWVAAQPSVLGPCGGGGAPSASVKGRTCGRGGGGCGVARCCARAQEKRPPRVRKTKEERRELVESFITSYRVSNDGKFPSVNLTHKEVGGSYYIVREIVRDIIQENRVLGPGGLDATALSFEDYPDSSESSMKHELGQDNREISNMVDDSRASKDSVLEISNSEESFLLHNNAISTQTLLGSSDLLEAGVLNSIVQNGSATGTTCLETSLEKQDEVPSEGSIEIDLNSSEEQAPSFAQVSGSDKEIELDTLGDAHGGTGTSVTEGVILSSESSAVYEANGALLREHETLPNDDSHDRTADTAVSEANFLAATNGVLQTKQTFLEEHDASTESVSSDDALIADNQLSAAISANPVDGFTLSTNSPETEEATETIDLSKVHRLHDEPDASRDEQENSGSLVSHLTLDAKGLLQMEDKHSVSQVDESGLKKSTSGSGILKEEVEASDATHEQGMSTTTAISRRTLKAQQKKYDNLFWLVLRAFVVAISKIWAK